MKTQSYATVKKFTEENHKYNAGAYATKIKETYRISALLAGNDKFTHVLIPYKYAKFINQITKELA